MARAWHHFWCQCTVLPPFKVLCHYFCWIIAVQLVLPEFFNILLLLFATDATFGFIRHFIALSENIHALLYNFQSCTSHHKALWILAHWNYYYCSLYLQSILKFCYTFCWVCLLNSLSGLTSLHYPVGTRTILLNYQTCAHFPCNHLYTPNLHVWFHIGNRTYTFVHISLSISRICLIQPQHKCTPAVHHKILT